MHIAICDDNIADRKQTERMLKRDSDKRKELKEAIYIDSFGNIASLMHSPMTYQLFFIDYHSENRNAYDIATLLRNAGVLAPIYICGTDLSDIEDRLNNLPLEHLYPIEKPFQANALATAVDLALDVYSSIHPPIEIRGMEETIYMRQEELEYLKCMDRLIELHRANGDVDYIPGVYEEAFHSLENNDLFIFVGKHHILNALYIDEVSINKVNMKNGDTIIVSPFASKTIRKILQELKKNQITQ